MSAVETALVVDDDFLMRDFVIESLRREQVAVTEAADGLEACRLLERQEFDLAFIDLKMPGMGGMDLLKRMQSTGLKTLPVIVTAFGTVEKAVEAVKNGAYDFLMKPFSPEQVSIIVKRARELMSLRTQNKYLREELGTSLPGGRQIIGDSQAVRQMLRQIEKVAKTDSTVLITGESGTGKELVGLAIHSMSARKDAPFIRMNCAAVPDTLVDSELFGHERGAFTNAVERRIGRFELADSGTLLLDEIAEMDTAVQAKLLRVIQEREFERVGGSRTVSVNTRVLASTNRDLYKEVEDGKFRGDLFYRLNVVPVRVPTLRERSEDIPLLVNAFLKRFCRDQRELPRFSDEAMRLLSLYDWPGNIRELENLIEHICVMEERDYIEVDALPPVISGHKSGVGLDSAHVQERSLIETTTLNLQELERQTIMRALKEQKGNRNRTAKVLGISVRTLRNKLNRYRLEDPMPVAVAQ